MKSYSPDCSVLSMPPERYTRADGVTGACPVTVTALVVAVKAMPADVTEMNRTVSPAAAGEARTPVAREVACETSVPVPAAEASAATVSLMSVEDRVRSGSRMRSKRRSYTAVGVTAVIPLTTREVVPSNWTLPASTVTYRVVAPASALRVRVPVALPWVTTVVAAPSDASAPAVSLMQYGAAYSSDSPSGVWVLNSSMVPTTWKREKASTPLTATKME